MPIQGMKVMPDMIDEPTGIVTTPPAKAGGFSVALQTS